MSQGVDYEKCDLLVNSLKGLSLPHDKDNPPPSTLGPELSKDFFLALVAICHQTTPLIGTPLVGESRGRNLRGWDYLKDRLQVAVEADNSLVLPPRLSTISGNDIVEIMSDGKGGGQITDSEGRARLLKGIGTVMTERGWENSEAIYRDSDGYLKRPDGSGLLANLAQMEAFNDPLQKKSFIYLSFMANNGLWRFNDPEHLASPVDYHVSRGFLRLGIIQVDQPLAEKLATMAPVGVDEDLAIRGAVYDAVEYVSKEMGRPAEDTHHIFWNVFRNCCNREAPHCDGCPPTDTLPQQYKEISGSKCLFADVCDRRTELLEHNFITDWY